jgi:hypothetical protein
LMNIHINIPFDSNCPPESLAEIAFKEHMHDGLY